MNTTFENTIERASELLALKTRTQYAQDVLYGNQRWSGADLKGNARKYGADYYNKRILAECALRNAGGTIVSTRLHGERITAVYACVDDFGNEVYWTWNGPASVGTELR